MKNLMDTMMTILEEVTVLCIVHFCHSKYNFSLNIFGIHILEKMKVHEKNMLLANIYLIENQVSLIFLTFHFLLPSSSQHYLYIERMKTTVKNIHVANEYLINNQVFSVKVWFM